MRAVSLFSGVGGFEIGMERAGIETVLQCEIDPVALSVLRRHWPNVPKVEDVRTVTAASVAHILKSAPNLGRNGVVAGRDGRTDPERLRESGAGAGNGTDPNHNHYRQYRTDLIYGGFPCQDLSMAGKRVGLGGDRSVLWFEFHRIVSELRPRWVVVENVFGARSFPADFATILTGLSDLGYGVAWRELDAQFFSVPQRRRRIFWVATHDSVDGLGAVRAAEILALCEGCGRDSQARNIAGKRATRRIKARAGMGGEPTRPLPFGAIPIQDGREIEKAQNGLGVASEGDPAYTVDGTGSQAVFVFETRIARNGRDQPSDIVPPLKAQSGRSGKGDGAPMVAFLDVAAPLRSRIAAGEDVRLPGRGGEDDSNLVPVVPGPLGSLTGGFRSTDLDGMGAWVPTINGIRRLMPIECERIMAWPDSWTKYRDDGTEIPDTHRYRMIGNGVASTCAEFIGRRLVAADTAPS